MKVKNIQQIDRTQTADRSNTEIRNIPQRAWQQKSVEAIPEIREDSLSVSVHSTAHAVVDHRRGEASIAMAADGGAVESYPPRARRREGWQRPRIRQ